MSTLATLRTNVKSLFRETTTELDTFIDEALNRAYKKFSRRFRWKQLFVENASLTLTAGTELYALPTAFWVLQDNSIRYNVTATLPGDRIRNVSADDLQTYKLLYESNRPIAAAIVGPASGATKRMEFAPSFTETAITVYYDYWATPTALTANTSPVVEELEEIMTYEAARELAEYHDDYKKAGVYMGNVREWLKSMLQASIAQ